jgi:hypothetical protein
MHFLLNICQREFFSDTSTLKSETQWSYNCQNAILIAHQNRSRSSLFHLLLSSLLNFQVKKSTNDGGVGYEIRRNCHTINQSTLKKKSCGTKLKKGFEFVAN